MRTGPLVKRQQPKHRTHNIIELRSSSFTATSHRTKKTDIGVRNVRVTAANPDNLPQLSAIIDLFVQDTFSLFYLSFPQLQHRYSNSTEKPFKTSLENLGRLPQRRSLQKLFQRQLSRDAILLTVQRGSDLLAATLLRPLWNIPNTLEILAFGINWNAPSLASLLLETPVSSQLSGTQFIPSAKQREYLSQHLLHISISKLPSTSSSEPSLFTVVNNTQQRHMYQSHLSLLGCYSVGTLNVRGKKAQTHLHHIFALPVQSVAPAQSSAFARVLPRGQILREHGIPQYKRQLQNRTLQKTYIPECIRPSLRNIIENHGPLIGLTYEITPGSSSIHESERHPLKQENEKLAPLGLHTCLLTNKTNTHYVEALHRSGKDLLAILPLASGETYGIFGEYRSIGTSKARLIREKSNQLSTMNTIIRTTPQISTEQENSTHYFCSDHSEPEMIPS